MTMDEFDFALPPSAIAQHPARPRDSARLLAIGATLSDATVRDLPALLRPGDILVTNDTRVIPAELSAMRGGARIGITLDQPLPDGSWHALARNARRLRPGDVLDFGQGFSASVRGTVPGGSVTLAFDVPDERLPDALARAGALALPPYIDRPDGPTEADATDYQTLFARRWGAVAAPTAGLHFTPALMEALEAGGVRRASVTLHVGAGTFLPVRDTVEGHRMHAERGEIGPDAADAIGRARADGGRVVAVGTTTVRLLESAARDGAVRAFSGTTDIFIRPGHRFAAVDLMLTNFHLPRSTLFMLVCAFAGTARMRAAYAHAVGAGYRFYSYGDACLIERDRALSP